MDGMVRRWATEAAKHACGVRRIVYVAGARQCGKTTLLRQLAPEGREPLTLDDPDIRQSAAEAPMEFVARRGEGPMLIDEIQKVPDLLPAMKMCVDRNRCPGQYLITGSANLAANPKVRESLAGRMATLRLRTFAVGELLGRKPGFLEGAFEGDFPAPAEECGKRRLIELALRGGYPEAVALPEGERAAWHRDYLDALLARDVRDVAEIRKLPALRRMAAGLAGLSSRFLNLAEFARAFEVSKPTAEGYVAALEALYLFDRLPPWTPRDGERAIRSPKWFAADTGCMGALLGWTADGVFLDPARSGMLAETFAYHQLAAEAGLSGRHELYHYRDGAKREIDFLVRDAEGRFLGIEVKAGSVVRTDDFRHLEWFRAKYDPGMVCVVVCSGKAVLPFGRKRYAVPFGALFGR